MCGRGAAARQSARLGRYPRAKFPCYTHKMYTRNMYTRNMYTHTMYAHIMYAHIMYTHTMYTVQNTRVYSREDTKCIQYTIHERART